MQRARRRKDYSVERRAYQATRSLVRLLRPMPLSMRPKHSELKVAFIHAERRLTTGASHINQLMAEALVGEGVRVKNFYPKVKLLGAPSHLRGIASILFFHSLLEHKSAVLKNQIIQGTTYTTLPFLTFDVPTISHFGSTTRGFLDAVPRTAKLPAIERSVYRELFELGIIPEFDFKTFRPLEDTADIEALVAKHVTRCIATSQKVREELEAMHVAPEHIALIHNAIEDYWFESVVPEQPQPPHIVFLGRLGGDVFTLKLKGFARLVWLYRAFPTVPKTTVCMTVNPRLKDWLRVAFPLHHMFVNLRKDFIPGVLSKLYGSILFVSSRYEGFSLSLIEGMSQGLVPVTYPVGVAPEIIRDGENGFIISTREEACARVRELLNDDVKRLAMAAAARETARQFSRAHIVSRLITLYREVRMESKQQQRELSQQSAI